MPQGSIPSEKKKVCIIDDEQDILDIYQTKFSQSGFAVVTAKDGAQGLAVIEEEKPDVVLLDLHMPVMDGYQVLDTLAGQGKLSELHIILLTNLNSDEIFRKVGKFQKRFDLLLKSMITPSEAVEYVRKVLERSKKTHK